MEIPIAVGPSGNLQVLDHLLMTKKRDNFYLSSTYSTRGVVMNVN